MNNIEQAVSSLKAEKEVRIKSLEAIDRMILALEKIATGDPLPAAPTKGKAIKEPA